MILAHMDSDFDADACLRGVLPSACLLSTVYIFLNQLSFDLSFISLNDGVDRSERRLWHPRGGDAFHTVPADLSTIKSLLNKTGQAIKPLRPCFFTPVPCFPNCADLVP